MKLTLSLPKNAEPLVIARRLARMEAVDALTPEWREFVHEYGFTIAKALMDCGVKKVRHGKHIVNTILDEMHPLRGTSSCQGPKVPDKIDVARLPGIEPTEAMIEASMATVSTFDINITKREKHRLRLRAAVKAEMEKGRSTPTSGGAG